VRRAKPKRSRANRQNPQGAPVLGQRPLFSVLLLLGTLAVAVLLPVAELVVRLVAPEPLPSQEMIRSFVLEGMYELDEEAGYRLSPNYSGTLERAGHVTEFSTNSLGLRNAEIGEKVAPRVLALGDSFTFGFGVAQDETWAAVLGQALEPHSAGAPIESINGGVNGYGTDAALALLRRVGSEVEPDLILLGFYSNDYIENFLGTRKRYGVSDGYLFDELASKNLQENLLARESHLYRLLAKAQQQIRGMLGGGAAVPPPGFSHADFAKGAELTVDLILQLKAEADRLGARLGIIWIPTYVLTVQKQKPVAVRAGMMKRIEDAGIPSIDLLPLLARQPNRDGLYLRNDGHFSVRGNQVAARILAEWIQEQGLLSQP